MTPIAAPSVLPTSARTRRGPTAAMVLRIVRIARSLTTVAGGLHDWPALAVVAANRAPVPRREVEAGQGHDPDEVYAEYAESGRDPWRMLVMPVLRAMLSRLLAEATGLSTRSVREIRNGHSRSRPRHRTALVRAAGEFARARLSERGEIAPIDDLTACATWLAGRRPLWRV